MERSGELNQSVIRACCAIRNSPENPDQESKGPGVLASISELLSENDDCEICLQEYQCFYSFCLKQPVAGVHVSHCIFHGVCGCPCGRSLTTEQGMVANAD
eukprot:TRINITY_DN10488_c0_g1_i1.p3 TRINITY_DN10488_c0_g1~~TRINITY_DN10488_c0_g1_i1.p3  ORF type:complete len:101 (-),score=13.61 TRINITY_DN10488_c0_g1_i1:204-506(-)